ncbi:MAG: hypothetical protein V4530_17570 [Pseudomonadota bacterium]
MSEATTRDYYLSRSTGERYKAEHAPNPAVGAVHRELAAQYDARVAAMDDQSDNPPRAVIYRANSSVGQSQT